MSITFRLGFETQRYTLRQGVQHVLDKAPDYYDGKVERIIARQAKLEEMVLSLAELLPADKQKQFAIDALGATYVQSHTSAAQAKSA